MDNRTEEEKKEWFEYLDRLRESGRVNMFGAAEYLWKAFGISQQEARETLIDWMDSYEG